MLALTAQPGIHTAPPLAPAGAKHRAGSRAETLRELFRLLLLFCLAPVTLSAQPYEENIDLYLMNLAADAHLLAEAVSTYRRDDGIYFIHFASFLEAVEFPISREGSRWTGWYRNEESRFSWLPDTGETQLSGSAKSSSPAASFVRDEGRFVSTEALETWFDLSLQPNDRTQTIEIVSSDPLPLQVRKARASASRRYRPNTADEAVKVQDQYRWATMPLIDLSSRFQIQGGARKRTDAQAAITMGLDLLKHSVLYAGATGERIDQRLTIERRASLADGTLGLGIDSYAMGDIVSGRSNLTNGGGRGAGFSIQRRAGNGGGQNRIAVTGNGPPGWDAELYRNDVLVTFGSVTSDGLYLFPDQETVYGENIFLVRLYGPQGQIREERHSFWGGGIDLDRGDYSLSVSHLDFTERTIGAEHGSIGGLPSAKTTDLHYAHALTNDLQLGTGYTKARLASRANDGTFSDNEYATLDARMNLGSGLLLAELAKQQERGNAWSLQYLTGFRGHNVSLSRKEYRDFESAQTLRQIAADVQNQLTISGPLELAGLHGYTLRFVHQDRADGLSDFRLFNRLGARWGPVNFSNDLDYLEVSGNDGFLAGRLRATGRWNRLSLSGQLDYNPADSDPLNQVSALVRWNAGRDTYFAVNVHKGLKNERSLNVDTTMSTRVGRLDLSVSLNKSSSDYWAAGVTLGTRIGRDAQAASIAGDTGSVARTGRATLNLFIDRNNNGVREPDETPLDWAAYKDYETSATGTGVIRLASVPAHLPLTLKRRDFRFRDPFLTVRDEAYELYTHPGSDVRADIPVVITGDVEGHLHPVPGRDSKVSGVDVILFDAHGERVAATRSEYDGYYSFQGLAAGQYEAVVTASSGKADMQRQRFALDADEGFVSLPPMFIYWN